MICGMTYYQICWYFLIYSFLGWVIEVVFHAVTLGKVINRGFLNGPVCPVYGFGMLSVLAAANTVENAGILSVRSGTTDQVSTLVLFLGGMALATLVELIAGWLLDVLFHTRWWDYSDKPLNFKGYICLEFSLIWGLAITLVVRILQPIMESSGTGIARSFPERYGWWVLLALYLLYLADLIVTVMTVVGLNKKLKRLDEARNKLRLISDSLSGTIGTGTIRTSQVIGEGQVQAALAKAELKDAAKEKKETFERSAWEKKAAFERSAAEKRAEWERSSGEKKAELLKARENLEKETASLRSFLLSSSPLSGRRLLKAFPRMKNRDHAQQLEELKKDLR